MLSTPDLLESRVLSRRISLLSEHEEEWIALSKTTSLRDNQPPSRRQSCNLRAPKFKYRTSRIRMHMHPLNPMDPPTQTTPHASHCSSSSSAKIPASSTTDPPASATHPTRVDFMHFFGIVHISSPSQPESATKCAEYQKTRHMQVLEARCPYDTKHDPRLHEILELLKKTTTSIWLP